MGNNLTLIAKYCDCLEKPWEDYQEPEDEESQKKSSSQSRKTAMENLGQQNMAHHDKQIVFDVPLKQQNERATNYKNFPQIKQTSEFSSEEDYNYKRKKIQDQMEIIDLQKIEPYLKAEARTKSIQPKHRPGPLIIEQHSKTQPLFQQQKGGIFHENPSEDTLSNVFEETKAKYFIEDDESQFYHRQKNKNARY